jgi:bisphosphoglycerate-dependent phosphoglycerate mutase
MDEMGYNVTQEDNFKTFEEANQEANDCIERWGEDGQDFWAEQYEVEPPKEERYYNNNAVDGWEDMFPSYDESLCS